MIYLLDSNVCIRYINGTSSNILRRVQIAPQGDIVICSVVKGELFYGAAKSNNPAATLAQQQSFLNQLASLPFDDKAALIFGEKKPNCGKPELWLGRTIC